MKPNPYESPSGSALASRQGAARLPRPHWRYSAIGWAQLLFVGFASLSIVFDGGVALLVQYLYLLGPPLTSAALAIGLASNPWVRLINGFCNLITMIVWFPWLMPILERLSLPGNPTCLVFGVLAIGLAAAGTFASLELPRSQSADPDSR